jgi:hypothetical protein
MKQEMLDSVQRQGQEIGNAHAHFVNDWLVSKLTLTAQIPTIMKSGDPESYLKVLNEAGGFYLTYFAMADNANHWSKRPDLAPDWFGPKRPWYQYAEQIGKPGVTDPISIRPPRSWYCLSSPLRSKAAKPSASVPPTCIQMPSPPGCSASNCRIKAARW